jgi:hypothetical protein
LGKIAIVPYMPYQSVDKLQKALAETVFIYADDKKKAAGRALGTLVEIITFYLLKTWGLGPSVAIERGLEEYQNPDIIHNVEYSLHPVKFIEQLQIAKPDLPITPSKIFKTFGHQLQHLHGFEKKSHALLSSSGVLRNACVLGEENNVILVGLVSLLKGNSLELDLVGQYRSPYAMFECKRVGVEEGNKKGPQTIEKAKQGAYVARAVSSLQRIRTHSGELHGVISKRDGTLYAKPYAKLLDEVVRSKDPELLRHFILTVGVVSNHGNWFTSDNPNKELRVLAQSYDWLLFLTDDGLAEFIADILQSNAHGVAPAKAAFLASYSAKKKENRFTKVQMALEADEVLQNYFTKNISRIEKWFNVISPKKASIVRLKTQIDVLSKKDWPKIIET